MTNNDITDLLTRYDAWYARREELSAMEESEDGPPSSSQWEASDDEGNEMGGEAIELLRKPVTIWTCTVQTPDYPPVRATTVHATEDACFEALRDNFDPEGEADDEPPVAIVGHLENDGYVIDIDVHEVTR